MIVIFWLIAFAAGAGVTWAVQRMAIEALPAGPSSPLFMLLSLLVITLIFQLRVNLGTPGWRQRAFVIAPPDATIVGEVVAFFAAVLMLLHGGV